MTTDLFFPSFTTVCRELTIAHVVMKIERIQTHTITNSTFIVILDCTKTTNYPTSTGVSLSHCQILCRFKSCSSLSFFFLFLSQQLQTVIETVVNNLFFIFAAVSLQHNFPYKTTCFLSFDVLRKIKQLKGNKSFFGTLRKICILRL